MRAVIPYENYVRVKDITLNRVKNDTGALGTYSTIEYQLQMRQIYAKLNEYGNYKFIRLREIDIAT